MAHHSYWNLGGHDSGPIVDQELTLFADQYTPGDPSMVPGPAHVKPVKGTPFDFTIAKPIGKDLQAAGGQAGRLRSQLVVEGEPDTMRPAARVRIRSRAAC